MGFDFLMVLTPAQPAGYEPELPDEPGWFRLTMRGMAAVFESMRRAGVLEAATPRPELPQRLSDSNAAELDRQLATPSLVGGAVPHFKYLSNEDWLVLPEECAIVASRLGEALDRNPAALYPLENTDPQLLADYIRVLRQFVAFNSLAQSHGGYRVR